MIRQELDLVDFCELRCATSLLHCLEDFVVLFAILCHFDSGIFVCTPPCQNTATAENSTTQTSNEISPLGKTIVFFALLGEWNYLSTPVRTREN